MNQLSWNEWIDSLIVSSSLDLEELCGELDGIVVSVISKEAIDDRFIGETQVVKFIKIEANIEYVGGNDTQVYTRTVYNGMLPSCNYIGNYSEEQIFQIETIIHKYFMAVQSKNSHYWNIPIVETDLDLYTLLTLEELILPLRRGIPCLMDQADSLQIFRKLPQPRYFNKANTMAHLLKAFGLAVYTFKDLFSESTVLAPLTQITEYSESILDGYVRVFGVCARKTLPIGTRGLQPVV